MRGNGFRPGALGSRIIVALVLWFVAVVWLQSRQPYAGAEPRSYGYIWNLDFNSLQPAALERTHGYRDDAPVWRRVYGPVNVRRDDGAWQEEFQWTWIKR